MKLHFNAKRAPRAYTLIETLMASAILMIGVGAAASMSLTMITQEEINERTVRAMNHLENAAGLYRIGIEVNDIERLLPTDPVIKSVKFENNTRNVAGLGSVPVGRLEITYRPSGASEDPGKDKWTSGDKRVERKHTVDVFRGNSFVTP